MDRLAVNAHRFELKGESLRKKKNIIFVLQINARSDFTRCPEYSS